jgi:hypothetical protein
VIRNVRGTFFIVKVNCSAGGQCEEYYLIGYNTENRPVAPEYLGGLMADADFLKTFDYKVVADTAIFVTAKNYDGSDKLEDSTVTWFPLRIQKDSLVEPPSGKER